MDLYRPTLDVKTYDTITQALEKATEEVDLSDLGLVGVIGSMARIKARELEERTRSTNAINADAEMPRATVYGHDIDMIFFPDKDAPLGRAMTQVDALLNTVDKKIMADAGLTLSPSGRKIRQEGNYLGVRRNTPYTPVMVHRLIYPDLASIQAEAPDDAFVRFAHQEVIPVYGSWDAIFSQPERDPVSLDGHFYLEQYDLSAHATEYGFKHDREQVLMEAQAALAFLMKHHGVDVDLERLTDETPQAVMGLVQEAREQLDVRKAA